MHLPRPLLAVLLPLASCGGPEAAPSGPLPSESGPYTVETVARPGAIRGTCRLVGEAHAARLKAWPGMGTEAGQDDESVSTGPGQALGGCFVALAGIRRGKDWPEAMRGDPPRLLLTVRPGRYEPHLAWVRAGTQVDLRSEIRMDIHVRMLLGEATTIANLDVPPGGSVEDAAATFLATPGLVHVTEDARAAFNAWLLVSPHPYVDVTSAQASQDRPPGGYALDLVPPGDYEVVCRHEPMDRRETSAGRGMVRYLSGPAVELRRRVHVDPDAVVPLDFDVPGTVGVR